MSLNVNLNSDANVKKQEVETAGSIASNEQAAPQLFVASNDTSASSVETAGSIASAASAASSTSASSGGSSGSFSAVCWYKKLNSILRIK